MNKIGILPLLLLALCLMSLVPRMYRDAVLRTIQHESETPPSSRALQLLRKQQRERSLKRRLLETTNETISTAAVPVELSADGTLLNALMALVIPLINEGIAQFAPDPLDLDIAGTLDLGSLNFGCGDTGIKFPYNWAGVNGLSSFFIDTLELVPGTESVDGGCLSSLFSGTFNIAIASLADFVMDDMGAGFDAQLCGAPLAANVDGDIITNQPFLLGAIDLAGIITNGLVDIDVADIFESLAWDYTSVEARLDNVPAALQTTVSDVTTQMSSIFKTELVSTVEPTLRPIIEEQMKEQTGQASTASVSTRANVMWINAGFVRNKAQRNIANFAQSTRQFMGI